MTDLRIPLSEIRPDAAQPRKYFRAAALTALANSIKAVGQRTPIEVRALPEGESHRYEIIDGERRWRACQIAGIQTIRAVVDAASMSRPEQHFLSLVSNFHREGHTHVEISQALAYQVSEGARVADLAENLGKSQPWVYQYLALQKLTPKLQGWMHPETPEPMLLRFMEAVALASIAPDRQEDAYVLVMAEKPANRLKKLRLLAEQITGKERTGRPDHMHASFDRFVERLSAHLERVLDMKQADFEQVVRGLPAGQAQPVLRQLRDCKERVGLLLDSMERALGGTAKVPRGNGAEARL